jgi:DNA-binding response OmpR family regulator
MTTPAPLLPHRLRPLLLVVEDDDEIRAALARIFEHRGYAVSAASSGADFMDEVSRALLLEGEYRPPDAIITDICLPGADGLGVAEGLRAAGWQVPVFVISAFSDAAIQARVDALGGALFFDKPIDVDGLEAAVKRAIAAAPKERRANAGGSVGDL